MDNRPIGIFDSGVGGLTAMRALRKYFPDENFIYFGDSGRMPYGPRPRGQVLKFAEQNLRFISSFDVKLILVACGTISSNCGELLARWPIPVIDVLHPGTAAMAQVPGTAPLGIIATAASIRSGSFEQELRQRCPGRQILTVACPDFVPLIESGHFSAADPLLRAAVAEYLAPMKQAGIAALLLGCTHYGLITDALSEYLGDDVRLIGAAECAAEKAADMLQRENICGFGSREIFYTSGDPETFACQAGLFLGGDTVRDVRYIPPQEE